MSTREFSGLMALILLAVVAGVQPGEAQNTSTATEAVLRQMTQAAGVIFAGEVVAVRRPAGLAGPGQDALEGVIAIDLRVDQALRGPADGSIYTLREWAGLWTGVDRYRVGQRLLVFLHGPSRGGLSSPVGGKAGMVPLIGGGEAPGPYDSGSTAAEWLADLRWVEARAARAGQSGREGEAGQNPRPGRPVEPLRGRRNEAPTGEGALTPDPFLPSGPFANSITVAAPAIQPLTQVLNLCRGWMRASDAAL